MDRPVLNQNLESNVRGLYVAGDLAGAPVVKLAMEQGWKLAGHIAALPDARSADPNVWDVLVAGAGAAGLNAALELQRRGFRVLVIDKSGVGTTIAELPEGKWIYTEPQETAAVGPLPLMETTKDELVALWRRHVQASGLDVRTGEAIETIQRDGQDFSIRTSRQTYRARRVILAIGKSGNPRRLDVPGEDQPAVLHKLYSPKLYESQRILVVGGGNSAVEAALALAEQNSVTLSYRGDAFHRVSRENRTRLEESKVDVRLRSEVREFRADAAIFSNGENLPYDHAFVLIGSDPPKAFLHSLGLRLERDWIGNPVAAGLATAVTFGGLALYSGQSGVWPAVGLGAALLAVAFLFIRGVRGDRFALFGGMLVLAYTVYGAKHAPGHEFWPFRGWGYQALTFFDRPWSFWYTVLYTVLMTIFGIQAMKRWGWSKGDRFQIWRYVSLLSFQWVFFFLIPEVLFRIVVDNQWIGAELAKDPGFADQGWRSYGLVYAWPLFFYTFFGSPHQVWIVWGVVLSFVIIPALALVHGKRYCSWICGCGGLAETVGDRWRHLSPKGDRSIAWERMNMVVLAAAALITVGVVGRDLWAAAGNSADKALVWYRLIADVWLVGIVPITLYPFFGGKIWCRYWCPLAKMMEIFSKAFTRFKVSRFAIHANDKCISCGECTRNCQVGIDVMRFAAQQRELNNANSSCIGCGICISVCPMDVLTFERPAGAKTDLIQIQKAA